MTAIETKKLTMKFREKTAVNGLDLCVTKGELYSLLGVNGAGKTTTIKMLSCLLTPTSGDAVLLGDSIVSAPDRVKAKINVSPQETAVARNLTVYENLVMIAGIYGASEKDARSRASEMLTRLGMTQVARQKAKTLSGGYQRRLSIAMALITCPEILFLDEPTLGLDVIARRELWKVIEALKGQVTIILTTHYMEEAEALSDHIGVMAEGQLRAVGTAEELKERTGKASFEDAFIALATDGRMQ